jgi:subtilisin family serine protease
LPSIVPPVASATEPPTPADEPPPDVNPREAPIVPPADPNTSDGTRAGQLSAILSDGANPETVAGRYGITVLDFVDAINLALFRVPDSVNLDALRAMLADDPNVGVVEANSIVGSPEGHQRSQVQFSQPGDVLVADPDYGYELVGSVTSRCVTGSGVIVAVLDTGIDTAHPEFSGRLVAGWNVIDGTDNVSEGQDGLDNDGDQSIDEMFGHGTHVAGIVARVAPGAMIMPVKVLNDDGIGDAFGLAQGLIFATSAGADVINLSLSSVTDSNIVRAAIEAVRAEGVVVVAATGNSGHEEPKEYPAAIEGVIAVAATGPDDLKSSFSNYGAEIRMSAPGTDIESALPGGEYGIASGTSMAAPFIAAAVALTIERYPDLTPDEVAEQIQAASTEIDPLNPEYAGRLGAGRLDLITTLACSG